MRHIRILLAGVGTLAVMLLLLPLPAPPAPPLQAARSNAPHVPRSALSNPLNPRR